MVGAQLQECLQSEDECGLGFYHHGKVIWLWFELNPQCPTLVRILAKPPQRKKHTRPLSLFIKSRFVGRRLAAVWADEAGGRVLIFSFHRSSSEEDQSQIEIEARLFPRGQNLIARDGEKSVAENKPKDLPPSVAPQEAEPRAWSEIEREWLDSHESTSSANQEKPGAALAGASLSAAEKAWLKAKEKKSKALLKMKEELALKLGHPYRAIGNWLKTEQSLEVPQEWRIEIESKRSLAWNIENVFNLAKENERKALGTQARIAKVEQELAHLEKTSPQAHEKKTDRSEQKVRDGLLNRAEARGRQLHVADDVEVYIGKSAADNLALLRKAQPFDYWLHLRDQPGSHAIMRRTRSRIVTDSEFIQAATWVIEHSLKRRASELTGERFDLLIVECRYVRPIKGDKLGRVNYSHDRVLSIRL